MAVGARDEIDRMLVDKYLDKNANNMEIQESAISADQVMKVMNFVSYNKITHFQLSRRLQIACYGINAMTANYKKTRHIA